MKSIQIILISLVVVSISACSDKNEPASQYFANMYYSVPYDTYGEYEIFQNEQEAKLPVDGTISRGWMPYDYADSPEGYDQAKTELMKRRFRHVAGRSLMILRNYQGNSKTVGQQQMKGHFLISAIRNKYGDDFSMIKETYREIMEDAMDIKHTQEVVDSIASGEIKVNVRNADIPSPFSHNLILQESSDVLKMEDKKKRLQELHQQVLDRIDN